MFKNADKTCSKIYFAEGWIVLTILTALNFANNIWNINIWDDGQKGYIIVVFIAEYKFIAPVLFWLEIKYWLHTNRISQVGKFSE